MDNIKSAAKAIREALTKIDFGKFCDTEELKHSWSTTKMPGKLTLLFSKLFEYHKNNIIETMEIIQRTYSQRDKNWKMKSCQQKLQRLDHFSKQCFTTFTTVIRELIFI